MIYTEEYFAARDMINDNGHVHQIAVRVRDFFNPSSVLDVGCGRGWVVKHLEELGITACGIDIASYGIENKVCRQADRRSFLEESRDFDLILANRLLQCLDDDEVQEFAVWAYKHCTNFCLILNSPNDGDKYGKPSDCYIPIFEGVGWKVDKLKQKRLQQETHWDCLVFLQFNALCYRRPILTPRKQTVSIVVDCWQQEYFNEFIEHIRELPLIDVELILVNVTFDLHKVLTTDNNSPLLTGTKIPVQVVSDKFRSTASSYKEGLRLARGAATILMQCSDRLGVNFISEGLKILLNEGVSFVVPRLFITTPKEPEDKLFSFPMTSLAEQFHSSSGVLDFATVEARVNYVPGSKLSEFTKPEFISPVFIARTADLLDCDFPSEQLSMGAQDALVDLAYRGKEGAVSNVMHSFTITTSGRFAPEEVDKDREFLLNRQRNSNP